MNSSKKGVIAVMSCAMLWSIGGLLIKLVSWSPFAIAGARSLIASIVLLVFLKRPRITFSFAQVGAAVSYAATMILFVLANKTTTAANAIILQYTSPVFAAFLGWMLIGERPSSDQWIALAFVMGGMAMFFMDKLSPGNMLGNIIAVISGITFALFSVFMRMQKDGSPLESMLMSHWLVVLVSLPVVLALPAPAVTPSALGAIAVLGIFQTGISSVLFSIGIKGVTAVQSMLLAVIEPILNPVWVFVATGERPGANALVGGIIILASVTVSSLVTVRRARRASLAG